MNAQDFLVNGTAVIPNLLSLLFTLAVALGLWISLSAMLDLITPKSMKRKGDNTRIAAKFIFGMFLTSMVFVSEVVGTSFFGIETDNRVVTEGVTATAGGAASIEIWRTAIIFYLALLGWCFQLSALWAGATGSENSGPYKKKALAKYFAGVGLVNIVPATNVISRTFTASSDALLVVP
ncbi:hypothetical protein A3709_19720 [Halioglobus sp. HI00S01]|uniref:hypothetical protein n=1 Tax=Halioglobus sp. HI00S01 TaxID=1822214 RepID=UPI0007C352C1|nr:hypothetical protein [Halioglobus sp. HI00S01]KZX57855.1 hypothetical protein A3709_19720 [Halioglobus sp. HI00S01]